jgi:hypothetical protein
VTKLAGEEKVGRTVELHQLVKLVRINVAKVDLGPRRRQSDGLGIFVLLIILFLPTAITTRGHFFCCKEKFSGSFDEKLLLPKVC